MYECVCVCVCVCVSVCLGDLKQFSERRSVRGDFTCKTQTHSFSKTHTHTHTHTPPHTHTNTVSTAQRHVPTATSSCTQTIKQGLGHNRHYRTQASRDDTHSCEC